MKEPLFKIDRQHHFQHNRFCLKANLGISPLFHQPALGRLTTFPKLTLLLVLGGAGSVVGQTAPAVSEINGEAGYAGGTMDGSEGNNFNATITLPVSHSLGFQADGLYSRIGAGDFYGGGGHFFWRDPDLGLFGLTGGYLYRSGVDTFQVAAYC